MSKQLRCHHSKLFLLKISKYEPLYLIPHSAALLVLVLLVVCVCVGGLYMDKSPDYYGG